MNEYLKQWRLKHPNYFKEYKQKHPEKYKYKPGNYLKYVTRQSCNRCGNFYTVPYIYTHKCQD